MSLSRRWFLLLVCLLLGAFASIISGWVCQFGAWQVRQIYASTDEDRDPVLGKWQWPVTVPGDWPKLSERQSFTFFRRRFSAVGVRSEDVTAGTGYTAGWNARYTVVGWPVPASRMTSLLHPYPGLRTTNNELLDSNILSCGIPCSSVGLAWLVPRNFAPDSMYDDNFEPRLAIDPVLPGFGINTLFYGTLAFITINAFSSFKRRRRARRGLCITCCYPLYQLAICPECGTTAANPSSRKV